MILGLEPMLESEIQLGSARLWEWEPSRRLEPSQEWEAWAPLESRLEWVPVAASERVQELDLLWD